jgi:hypothetical protein
MATAHEVDQLLSLGTRTSLGRRWRAEEVAPVATIARVLRGGRQSLYDTRTRPDGPRPPKMRSTPPPLLEGCAGRKSSCGTPGYNRCVVGHGRSTP